MPVANTIGEVGRGFQQQMMQFQDERLVACVSTIAGVAQACGRRRARWAEERMLFGKPLSKMQVTQFKLVELLTQLTAARELIHACVAKRVAGEDATELITMAKLFCGARVAPGGRRVHPAPRRLRLHEGEHGRARLRRLAGSISIGGGADETMIHYLAKQLGF